MAETGSSPGDVHRCFCFGAAGNRSRSTKIVSRPATLEQSGSAGRGKRRLRQGESRMARAARGLPPAVLLGRWKAGRWIDLRSVRGVSGQTECRPDRGGRHVGADTARDTQHRLANTFQRCESLRTVSLLGGLKRLA